MDLIRVTVKVNDRSVEVVTKIGVLASCEFGAHREGQSIPEHRVNCIGSMQDGEISAWAQVSVVVEDKSLVIAEGFLRENGEPTQSTFPLSAIIGSVVRVSEEDASQLSLATNASAGAQSCCTSYGSGCYVTCCNSCCSDPYRCPGASCCG